MSQLVQQSSDSHLSMSDDIRKAVEVHGMNLGHYSYKDIHASMDQLVAPINRVCEIDEAHCYALVDSSGCYKCDYVRLKITVYFSTAVNQDGAKYDGSSMTSMARRS